MVQIQRRLKEIFDPYVFAFFAPGGKTYTR